MTSTYFLLARTMHLTTPNCVRSWEAMSPRVRNIATLGNMGVLIKEE